MTLFCSAKFLLGCDIAPPNDPGSASEEPSLPTEDVETSMDPIVVDPATIWKWIGYMEKGWAHINRIDSFYNGEGADLAKAIDMAKEEILAELRGIAERSLIDRTEGAVNNYAQIVTAIKNNPP